MKLQATKKIEYKIGFVLLCIYTFASYVGVDVIISSSIKTITLYAFLAWGLLTTALYGLKEKISTYSLWYIIFMITSFLLMFYSPEFNIFSGEFYLMIVSFFITYFVQIFVSDERDFTRLCWIYAISSVVFVLMLQSAGELTGTESERLGGEFLGNSNIFANIMMIATMLSLWLFVYRTPKKVLAKIFLLCVILYNMYALALSAGRRCFVLPFIFLYLLLLFKTNKRGKRNIILYTVVIAIVCVIAFSVIMNVPVLYDSIGTRMERLTDDEYNKQNQNSSSALRETMLEDAIEQWKQKPILGYGFDSYKYRAKKVVGHLFYSHCNFTEMLYNGGIIYFIVYYWIFYKMIKDCRRKKRMLQKHKAFVYAIAISILISDYSDVSYSLASIQTLLALAYKNLSFETENREWEEAENGKMENIHSSYEK